MRSVAFTVPGKPIGANKLYRPRMNAPGIRKHPESRAYLELVAFHAMRARRAARHAFEGPCEVRLQCYFANPLADVDSAVKSCLDGLQHGKLIANDRDVLRLVVEKHVDRARPRVEVTVQELAS